MSAACLVQNGRIEYDCIARNADPEVCPVGAMAIWMFYVYHIATCNLDFSERRAWCVYEITWMRVGLYPNVGLLLKFGKSRLLHTSDLACRISRDTRHLYTGIRHSYSQRR